MAGSSLIGDDLAQVFDSVSGESRHAVLADTVDSEAVVFGEPVDREVVQLVLVLAEQNGDVADGKDGTNRRHDQAAWRCAAEFSRQFHGSNSSILWAGCPPMRASGIGMRGRGLGGIVRLYRATTAGSLTKGPSLKGALVCKSI